MNKLDKLNDYKGLPAKEFDALLGKMLSENMQRERPVVAKEQKPEKESKPKAKKAKSEKTEKQQADA